MRDSRTTYWPRGILLGCLSILFAGCSAANYLSTGSVKKNDAPKPVTATDRALHSAATSARAQRCGFVFDPAQLKANFVAAETQTGLAPDQVQKLSTAYDFARLKLKAKLDQNETYCSDHRTKQIKKALSLQLAGDFTPPKKKKVVAGGGLFDFSAPVRPEKFDTEAVFDPRIGKSQ